jgi:hypothetical protein
MQSRIVAKGRLGGILLSGRADGGMPVAKDREFIAMGGLDESRVHLDLMGVAHGFARMNAERHTTKKPQVVCAPDDLAMGVEDDVQRLDQELTRPSWSAETLIEPLWLRGLQRRFPGRT